MVAEHKLEDFHVAEEAAGSLAAGPLVFQENELVVAAVAVALASGRHMDVLVSVVAVDGRDVVAH